MKETIWLTKPKILPVWFFKEKDFPACVLSAKGDKGMGGPGGGENFELSENLAAYGKPGIGKSRLTKARQVTEIKQVDCMCIAWVRSQRNMLSTIVF